MNTDPEQSDMEENVLDVLVFAHRPRRGATQRGVVRNVDVDTSCVRIEFPNSKCDLVARLQAHECTDCLRDFVFHSKEFIFLTCDVAFEEVVQLNVTVNNVYALNAALDSGTYAAEEQLVKREERELHHWICQYAWRHASQQCLSALVV